MNESTLKPCPFCGADGDVEFHKTEEHSENIDGTFDVEKGWIVMCGYCCNRTMLWDYKKNARAAWNRRVRPAQGEAKERDVGQTI